MSYSPKHNYRAKDQLNPGDPEKIIYGSDLSDDFEAIAKEVSLLNQIDIDGDGTINIPPELIEGLGGLLDAKADQTDLDAEIAARDSGDANLQAQIDGLGSGDGTDYDDTQIKADLATETQARIDGDTALDQRIDAVEDLITDGFVDAPDDGKLYGRQSDSVARDGSMGWAEISMPEPGDSYDDTGIKADLVSETQARVDGDTALQVQIDGIEGYDDTTIKADIAANTTAISGKADPMTVGGAPADPSQGDQWLNTDDGFLYVYYDNGGSPTWVAVGGTA